MAKLIVEEQKEYPTLPADSIVHLRVETVEIKTVQGARGDWDKLDFKFTILGIQNVGGGGNPANYANLIGENIYGGTPAKITDSQENKLRLWAEAIFNRPMALGEELDTDYFLRREVRGVTSTYEKRAKDANGNPFIGHQIQHLLPLGAGATQGGAPGGAVQQQPVQQAPQSWGAPQAQAPAQDPWGTSGYVPQQQQAPQSPQVADPWGPPPAQPQYQGAPAPQQQQIWDDEPPF